MRSSCEPAKAIKIVTRRCRRRSRNLYPGISKRFDSNIKKTLRKDLVALHCRTLSIVSIRTPVKSGVGSGYFRQPVTMSTESAEKNAGIIFTSRYCRELSKRRGSKPAFSSRPVRTPCVIRLRRTYSKMAMTFGPYRNSWATTT